MRWNWLFVGRRRQRDRRSEDADGVFAEQGRQVRRADHRIRSEGPGAAKLPDDLIVWASDPEGDESYPIVTYTWIIAYKKYADAQKAGALKDVLAYCLTDGQKMSESLGYIPLPTEVAEQGQSGLGEHQGRRRREGRRRQGATPRGRRQFPAPLYTKWFKAYNTEHPEVRSTTNRWAAAPA